MRTFLLVAAIAALLGISQAANAQYGPMGGPAGPYPDMMGGGMMGGMPGMGMVSAPGGMPGPSPYAPQGLAPAAYAGIGGPAPMGPMPSAPTMSPMGGMPMQMAPLGMDGGMSGPGMPIGPGGGDYCPPDGGAGGWTQRYFGFGEFLYLRPANAEVAYAVPVNSAAAGGGALVQGGQVRTTEVDYSPSFRAGFGFLLSPRSAIAVTYTQFDRDTFDALSLPGNGNVIRSLVSNPNPITAAGNGLDTAATLRTQFELLDIDYRGLMIYNPEWQINYVVGARWGNLEQHFAAGFAPATGFEQVLAESEFDGGGLKLGLESLRFHPTTQFFCYGKGYASFLAGTFRTRYEFDSPTLTNPTLAGFNVGRVVTMLDMEAGVGWQSFTGNLRFSAGYMFSTWLNTVRVNEFINSVQTNNFADPSANFRGITTFDGLTTKIEVLW
jgi:hypothetical protein